ncbi:MAG: 50S ribosomal protein L17 [Magnetococcales bacterium]|nr:50S ribosomal protein L17 [Magnetococcales bacterium]MBF0149959.1 50S ribosomal protein L17 [Magnetococcales bacterium]MBF0346733.1 50S ribosomal protein L17 [Magnetococcales bacterium]MBF0630385.1 50S ribosomal protein L17 [Magnetococcales bacterium]
MRHRKSGRNLGRETSHRKAMISNMAVSLFRHERIETTVTRAKELRIFAERMVTLGKNGSLHARRRALGFLRDKEVVHKLFTDIAVRNGSRNGGYTRIIKTRLRYGDCAPMSFIELVEKTTVTPENA